MGKHKKVQNTQPTKEGDSTLVTVITYLLLPFGIAAAGYSIVFGLNNFIPRVYEVVPQYSSKVWNTDTQIELFVQVTFAYALYLLTITFLTMQGRLFAQKNPILQPDNYFIKTLNRILTNSVEQAAVFLPVYAYFVFYVSTPSDKELAIFIGLQFLASRTLYAVGYFIQALVKIGVIRSFAMVLTLGATVETLARIYVGPQFISVLNSYVPI